MAYTGAASIVLRTKGFKNAKTMHSWLYEPIEEKDYSHMNKYLNRPITVLKFVPKPLPDCIKLIFIDEASFIPMKNKEEILSRGVKVLCCGDLNQLPPVGDDPAFLNDVQFTLTKIMRQNEKSGIVYVASKILEGYNLSPGHFGNVDIIYKDEVTDEMLKNATMILCGFNSTRHEINMKVRRINGIDPDRKIPMHGEKLICRKNNWSLDINGISLANGLSGIVTNYPSMHSLKKNGKIFTIDFKPIMFDTSFKKLDCNFEFFNGDSITKDTIRNSRRRGRYPGNYLELSYAISTHLSQGSEFDNGIYFSEKFWRESENKALDYTAVTRFKDHCIIAIDRNKYY